MEEATTTTRKRHREEGSGSDEAEEEVAVMTKSDDDVDKDGKNVMAWLTGLDENTVTELFDILESSSLPLQPVKFIDDPYSSLVIFQSSSAYVTINGNEESCGSSFSDLESSVMASVDMGGIRGLVRRLSGELNVDGGGAEVEEKEGAARGWLLEKDFLEGVFVKSLSNCDLFASAPPSGYNYDESGDIGGGGGGDGGGGGEEEKWRNFVDEVLLDGSW